MYVGQRFRLAPLRGGWWRFSTVRRVLAWEFLFLGRWTDGMFLSSVWVCQWTLFLIWPQLPVRARLQTESIRCFRLYQPIVVLLRSPRATNDQLIITTSHLCLAIGYYRPAIRFPWSNLNQLLRQLSLLLVSWPFLSLSEVPRVCSIWNKAEFSSRTLLCCRRIRAVRRGRNPTYLLLYVSL